MFSSQAPSKLILAGEHSVVYGSSAITTRLSWSTHCDIQTSETGALHLSNGQEIHWDSHSLIRHWQPLQQRHQQWQRDATMPLLTLFSDLPLAVLAFWQQHYELPSLSIHLRNDIPIGQGLGSSASLIIALIQGLCQATATHLSLSHIQQMATECEQLAHGKSSGLDVAAILLSDRLQWQQGKVTQLTTRHALPGYLVFTGNAESSTADCVGWVRQHYADHQVLWSTMNRLSLQVATLLDQPDCRLALAHPINALHACLVTLGVVPKPVQAFAQSALDLGWSGKLCGAGSIRGDGGGFFWLLADQEPKTLCQTFGYDYWRLSDLSSCSSRLENIA
jgi:mevalonate kinase